MSPNAVTTHAFMVFGTEEDVMVKGISWLTFGRKLVGNSDGLNETSKDSSQICVTLQIDDGFEDTAAILDPGCSLFTFQS